MKNKIETTQHNKERDIYRYVQTDEMDGNDDHDATATTIAARNREQEHKCGTGIQKSVRKKQ